MKQLSSILLLVYLLNPLTTWGSDAEQLFLGFWKSQEAAGDTCVLNVKRGGRISCFWTESASKAVAKGRWEIEAGKLIAKWDSGYVDILTTQGEYSAMRQVFNPGQSLDTPPAHESLATKVDPRIPGSLVSKTGKENAMNAEGKNLSDEMSITPRLREEKERPDIPARNPFTGYWKIRQNVGGFMGIGSSDSEFFYINLDRSGKAILSLRNWEGGNALGTWTIVENEARITWPSGHKDILRQIGGESMSFVSLSPKQNFTAASSNKRNAERQTAAEASRFFSAGDVRMLTTLDIRGHWVEQYGENKGSNQTYLDIEPWGNATRRENATTTKGKWKLLSSHVILNWDDGSKDILRASYRGWTRESFSPGTPTTGRPYRTIPVEKK